MWMDGNYVGPLRQILRGERDGYGLAAVGLADATGGARAEVAKHLLAWPGFAACVAFDEWVANVDRHAAYTGFSGLKPGPPLRPSCCVNV